MSGLRPFVNTPLYGSRPFVLQLTENCQFIVSEPDWLLCYKEKVCCQFGVGNKGGGAVAMLASRLIVEDR